jgi:hypothetical protein
MITAKEARAQTEYRIDTIVQEFFLNNVNKQIQDAIINGEFAISVSLDEATQTESISCAIIKQLKDLGYGADCVYRSRDTGLDKYIRISWAEA